MAILGIIVGGRMHHKLLCVGRHLMRNQPRESSCFLNGGLHKTPFVQGGRCERTLTEPAEPFDNTTPDGYVGHLDEQFLSSPTWMRGTP